MNYFILEAYFILKNRKPNKSIEKKNIGIFSFSDYLIINNIIYIFSCTTCHLSKGGFNMSDRLGIGYFNTANRLGIGCFNTTGRLG